MSRKKGGRVTAESMARLERTERALALRRQGHTYREIAKELGCTLRQAHNLVTNAFKALQRHARAEASELKLVQDERLESMYKALSARVERGEPRGVEVALKVLERQAKLHGLDEPVKTQSSVTYHAMSDAELLDEAKKLRLDVHVHPPAATLLLPGETSLPPALQGEVAGLLQPPPPTPEDPARE